MSSHDHDIVVVAVVGSDCVVASGRIVMAMVIVVATRGILVALTLGIAGSAQERSRHRELVDVRAFGVHVLLPHLQGRPQRHAVGQGGRRHGGGLLSSRSCCVSWQSGNCGAQALPFVPQTTFTFRVLYNAS